MSITKDEELSLVNLLDGAAVSGFDRILREDIIPNIADPNTQADGTREITLKVAFKPDKNRSFTAIGVEVWPSKLAKAHRYSGTCLVGIGKNGEAVAREILSDQQKLFPDEDLREEVVIEHSDKVKHINS